MKKMLFNAIIGWYDDSIFEYKGLDDEEFIKKVCDTIGITEEFYRDCVLCNEILSENEPYITDEMSSSEIFACLSDSQKDDIYRMVWSDRVAEDVRGRLAENPDLKLDKNEEDALVEDVCNAYVYNGDYDCNLSYWDNIDNLISEYTQEEPSKQFSQWGLSWLSIKQETSLVKYIIKYNFSSYLTEGNILFVEKTENDEMERVLHMLDIKHVKRKSFPKAIPFKFAPPEKTGCDINQSIIHAFICLDNTMVENYFGWPLAELVENEEECMTLDMLHFPNGKIMITACCNTETFSFHENINFSKEEELLVKEQFERLLRKELGVHILTEDELDELKGGN